MERDRVLFYLDLLGRQLEDGRKRAATDGQQARFSEYLDALRVAQSVTAAGSTVSVLVQLLGSLHEQLGRPGQAAGPDMAFILSALETAIDACTPDRDRGVPPVVVEADGSREAGEEGRLPSCTCRCGHPLYRGQAYCDSCGQRILLAK